MICFRSRVMADPHHPMRHDPRRPTRRRSNLAWRAVPIVAAVTLLPLVLDAWSGGGGAAAAGRKATPAPQIQVDKSKVDLVNHRLEIRMSLPPADVEIKVLSETGEELADERHDFTGQPAGSPLVVTWTPSSDATAARIELTAHDVAGGFAGMAIVSWSLSIPHEEVVFKTDSAEIDESERPKLDASLQQINAALAKHKDEFGRPTLFIAGHTDTVGGTAYNFKLSQARAQAIARWFRNHGLRIPVAYEGFGEAALAVKTADNVDEPRNRRADYILAVEEPTLRATGFRPSWKRAAGGDFVPPAEARVGTSSPPRSPPRILLR
jgi:outer membrane protein OmpA-like peptidoglycan-associated protein